MLRRSSPGALTPSLPSSASSHQNLKTPHELEEEDRQAKSAKLQELIRRGTPKDLLKAQELMKDLSGFVRFLSLLLRPL